MRNKGKERKLLTFPHLLWERKKKRDLLVRLIRSDGIKLKI